MAGPPDAPEPPGTAERLLARSLGSNPAGRAVLGDLREDFHRIARSRGPGAARRWYWREALGLVAGRTVHGLARRLVPRFLRRDPGPGAPGGRPDPPRSRPFATLAEDARYAARSLRRSPVFGLFAVLLLGLGVGAVTLVFGVLEPLVTLPPLADPGELVWIANEGEPGDSSLYAVTHRTANLVDFRREARSFEAVTGYDAFFSRRSHTLGGDEAPERLVGVGVAHDFLQVLGVRPGHGRAFTAEEGRRGGPAPIILSHDLWRTRFGAEASLVGRALTVNGEPRTVVGVLPPDFDFASVFAPGADVDFLEPLVVARDNAFQGNVLALIGRLRPGVSPEAAQAELDAVVASLQADDPRRWGLGARVEPLASHLAGPVLPSLLLLAGASIALLALVCANVVGLILGRAPSRAREMAVRKALGAPRGRLVRQLVLETLAVALGGAVAGSAVAWAGTRALQTAVELDIPMLASAEVDGPVLAVATATAVVAGLIVGVLPALRVSEGGEARVLRTGSTGSGGGQGARAWREGLVVGEVALACGLLVVGGVLHQSFQAVLDVELGFQPRGVLQWTLQPSRDFGSHAERADFYRRLVEEVEARSGVERAALVDEPPLGRTRTWAFRVPGRPEAEDTDATVFPHVVSPGYLATLGIELVAGRALGPEDRTDAPPVVLLNETAARRIFGGTEAALGQRLRFFGPWEWEVVGVVADVRHLSPEMGPGLEVYTPVAQMPDFASPELVVRSSRPAHEVAAVVASALSEVDPGMPTRDVVALEARVRSVLSERRAALGVLSAFGLAALLVAGLGIYGLLARTVAERRPEIGVRMALGASAPEVVSAVVRRMMGLTAAGVAAGCVLALAATPWLEPLLFGEGGPLGAGVIVVPAAVLIGVAGVAAALPAWRAVATDPAGVLSGR